jgi:hypothetical protein
LEELAQVRSQIGIRRALVVEIVRVTVWNEYRHERNDEEAAKIYPDGIHGALAAALRDDSLEVHTATLDEPEHGLTEEVLDATQSAASSRDPRTRTRSSTGRPNRTGESGIETEHSVRAVCARGVAESGLS